MAGSVNKVILIGNLGKDPEVRHLENGVVVANFSIATSETFTDKNTGQKREITDWHNIVVWRGLAKVVESYVKKGMKVYVEGKLKTRSWQDEQKNTRYTTEVVADNLTMLTRAEPATNQSENQYPKSIEENKSQPMTQSIQPEEEDDLPF
ncbi:single-stranded DNA-binding protein [Putridiphycobacter roseus]|uniref:Single-stranded DNA-binding protein n=1 Tax=Putridiphycobacter roseus TaxID=2219161 RepID=A0A2W1NLK1_9FLAO|nr:single-stranded DNA-binding protein [Putridiphycobacter roseus]PZE16542.1 single-stranded DNA-binding protein [Putridiphycobacter roseus]